jgi:hypothetical protein
MKNTLKIKIKEKEVKYKYYTDNSEEIRSFIKKTKPDKFNYLEHIFKNDIIIIKEIIKDKIFLKNFDKFNTAVKCLECLNDILAEKEDLQSLNRNNFLHLKEFCKKIDIFKNTILPSKSDIVLKYSKVYPKLSILCAENAIEEIRQEDEKQTTLKILAEKYGVSYNTSSKYLDNICDMNFKVCYNIDPKKHFIDSFLETSFFCDEFVKFYKNQNLIIFIDESKFTATKKSKRRWVEKNKPNIAYFTDMKVKANLLLACSQEGVVYYEIHEMNLNQYIFKNFMINLAIKLKENSSNKICFIVDNCTSHVTKDNLLVLDEMNINLITLPRYFPLFNTCEFVFQILKKQFYRTLVYS